MSDPTLYGVHSDIGALKAEVAGLRREVGELTTELKALTAAFNEVKGGSRVVFGLAAAIGAILAVVVQWLLGKWHP